MRTPPAIARAWGAWDGGAWAAWAAWAGWWGAVDSLFDGMGEGGNKGERRDGKWHWMPVVDVSIADGKGRGALLVGTDALQWSDGGGGRGGHGNGDQQRDGAKMSNE